MCTHAKYEQYLDDIYGQGYGARLKENDTIAFCVGYHEWARQKGCSEWEDCDGV